MRTLLLKKSALPILLLCLALLALPVLAATTLTFEDAPLGASMDMLAYPGVTFSSVDWYVREVPFGAAEGQYLIGPCYSTLTIAFAAPQEAVSFTWASIDYTLQVDAFLNGSPAGTSHFAGDWWSSASVTGAFDTLVIGGGTEEGCAAIDNLTYNPEVAGEGLTFTDGRINRYDTGAPVVLYPVDGGLDVYAAAGKGLLLRVSAEQIAAVPECPETNTTIAEDAATGIIVSRLAGDGCPFQLNAPTAEPGKTYVIIFDELSSWSDYESFEG